MADDVYDVLLVEGARRWHTAVVVGEEEDRLLSRNGKVLVFGSRPALEHAVQESAAGELSDELPDELDLDLAGWLSRGAPQPSTQEVSELWHLLVDDPAAGRPLRGEVVEEAYDDLVEDQPDWFAEHGDTARRALAEAVRRLRGVLERG